MTEPRKCVRIEMPAGKELDDNDVEQVMVHADERMMMTGMLDGIGIKMDWPRLDTQTIFDIFVHNIKYLREPR